MVVRTMLDNTDFTFIMGSIRRKEINKSTDPVDTIKKAIK